MHVFIGHNLILLIFPFICIPYCVFQEPPGQPPGPQSKEKSQEDKADNSKATMDTGGTTEGRPNHQLVTF